MYLRLYTSMLTILLLILGAIGIGVGLTSQGDYADVWFATGVALAATAVVVRIAVSAFLLRNASRTRGAPGGDDGRS